MTKTTAMPPLVSIITPCYRQAHFLPEAIESVLSQTYQHYEVIVIDDGSPDRVEEVAQRYPVSLLRSPERRGLSQARNFGLQHCRGEYLVCLDADDRLLPDALAVGVTALSNQPGSALVWGDRRLIDERGHQLPDLPRRTTGKVGYADLLRGNLIGPPVGVMFRRVMVEAAGGFAPDVSLVEDYDLYLRLAREHDCYGHGELIAEYRIHSGNLSANSGAMLQGVLAIYARQAQWIGRSRELRRAVAAGRRWARLTYDVEQRLALLSKHARSGRWASATVVSSGLLFRYPRVFLPILLRRVRRTLTRTH